MYLFVRGMDYTSFYDFSMLFWNSSYRVWYLLSFIVLLLIIKRKLKHWWSTIQPISTKQLLYLIEQINVHGLWRRKVRFWCATGTQMYMFYCFLTRRCVGHSWRTVEFILHNNVHIIIFSCNNILISRYHIPTVYHVTRFPLCTTWPDSHCVPRYQIPTVYSFPTSL